MCQIKEIPHSTSTTEPEPGYYEARFISIVGSAERKSTLHNVQVIILDQESYEVTNGLHDPVTRQRYEPGQIIVRYVPSEEPEKAARTGEGIVEFPKNPTMWESITLESLRYLNEPTKKEIEQLDKKEPQQIVFHSPGAIGDQD